MRTMRVELGVSYVPLLNTYAAMTSEDDFEGWDVSGIKRMSVRVSGHRVL
jgi:hypothetical protein